MDVEKKTLIYILIGLLYISTTVIAQAGWNSRSEITHYLVGTYDEDNHPDLVVDTASPGAEYGDLNNFIYNGHYISRTAVLAKKNKFHEGIFLFRLNNENLLKKKYNRIQPNSSIKITAFNDIIFSPDVNQSYHCETLNMTVKQNNTILENLDVEDTGRLEKFKVSPHPTNSKSNITLNINPSKKCEEMPQILGIDKFYLEEPSYAKPAGIVNQVLHKISP